MFLIVFVCSPESNSTNGTFRGETECRCVAEDDVRCFSGAGTVDQLISMEVTVCSGPLTAHAPIMSFRPWDCSKDLQTLAVYLIFMATEEQINISSFFVVFEMKSPLT